METIFLKHNFSPFTSPKTAEIGSWHWMLGHLTKLITISRVTVSKCDGNQGQNPLAFLEGRGSRCSHQELQDVPKRVQDSMYSFCFFARQRIQKFAVFTELGFWSPNEITKISLEMIRKSFWRIKLRFISGKDNEIFFLKLPQNYPIV